MLDKFRAAKQAEIDALCALADQDALPAPYAGKRPSFSFALRAKNGGDTVPVIAEYKRASPSLGEINMDLTPEMVADAYARGGASAMSVLTEETYFKGELGFLERVQPAGLPLLRKDFILHPLQIRATAATPASAFLVIVRMVPGDEALAKMICMGREAGLEAVVEVFNAQDLARARRAGAAIIQVNNRDLDTLVTDMDVSAELVKNRRSSELWICASGIAVNADLVRAGEQGYDAVLVGTSLMRGADPETALKRLRGAVEPEQGEA